MYKVNFNKSCSGVISWPNNIVYTIDKFNDNNYDPIEHILDKTFINYKIEKEIHKFIEPNKSIEQFVESEKKSEYYDATNSHVRQFIKHYKYQGDKIPDSLQMLVEKKETITCPVTKDTYPPKKEIASDPYAYDIISNGQDNKIIQYLDKVGGTAFYYIDDQFIIIPDLFQYPVTKRDVSLLNLIKQKRDYVSLFNFLTKFNFNLFIRGDTNNYKYKNIYSIDSNELIKLFKDIQMKIFKFYESFFGHLERLNDYIISYIYPDTKSEYILIKFFLFDVHKGYKYISFINYFKNLSIKFIINALESGQDITYYKRFNLSEKGIINCQNNFLYNSYHQTGGGRQSLKNLLTGNKNATVKILNTQYQNVNTKGYCSIFLLVSVTLNKEERVYEITFKTTTYSKLASIQQNNFKEMFYEQLKKVLNSNTHHKIEYENEYQTIEYFEYLPTNFEIKIKPVQTPTIKVRLYFSEPATTYWNETLPNIKNKTNLDSQIILYMLYQNNINNDIGSFIQNSFGQIPYLNKLLSGQIITSNNFLIKEKTYYTGYEDKYFYVLWYFPKYMVTDQNKFNELLLKIVNDCKNLNEAEIDNQLRNNYQPELSECTNYFTLYQDYGYIHNLKHLTPEHKTEIDELLHRFYQEMGYRDFTQQEIYLYPYILFCNYPGSPSYNNFHMQIYSFKNINEMSKTKFDIRNYNYIDPNVSRAIAWELVKNYDYSKLDSIISYDLEYDKTTNTFKKDAFNELVKKAGRPALASNIPSDETLTSMLLI